MELREKLQYPERDLQKEQKIKELLLQFSALAVEADGKMRGEPLLEELNRLLPKGRFLRWEDVSSYLGWTDADTLARDLALPEAPLVEDITREETEYLVQRILEDPAGETVGYYLEMLDRTFPGTSVSELIFNPEWCEDYEGDGEPSAEEIVEIAFRSRNNLLELGDRYGK